MKYIVNILIMCLFLPISLFSADNKSNYDNMITGMYSGLNSSFDILNNMFFSPTQITLSEYIANYMLSMISNMFFVLVLIVAVVNIYTWLTQGGQQFFNLFMNTLFATILTFFMFYLTGSKTIQLQDSGKEYKSYLIVESITSLFYVSQRFADFMTYNLLFGANMKSYPSPKLWETSVKSGPTGDEILDGFVFTYLVTYVKNSHKRAIDEITKNTNDAKISDDMKGEVVKDTEKLKDKVSDIASPANIKYIDDLAKTNIALLLPYATFNINMSQPYITPTTSKYNYNYNIYDPNTQEILSISKDVEITHGEDGLESLTMKDIFNQDDNLQKLFTNSNNQMNQALDANINFLDDMKSKYISSVEKTEGQQAVYNDIKAKIEETKNALKNTKTMFKDDMEILYSKTLDQQAKEFVTLRDVTLSKYSEGLLGFTRNKFNDTKYINEVSKTSKGNLLDGVYKTTSMLMKNSALNENRAYALELDSVASVFDCYQGNVLEKLKQYGGVATVDSGNLDLTKKCTEPLQKALEKTVERLDEAVSKINTAKFGETSSGGSITLNQVFSKSLFNQKDIKLGDKYYFHWTDLGMFYTGIKSGMGTVASLYNIALKNELKNEQMVNVFKGVQSLTDSQADAIIKRTAENQIMNIALGAGTVAGVTTGLTQLGGVMKGITDMSTKQLFSSSLGGISGLVLGGGKVLVLSAGSFLLTFGAVYIMLSIVYYALPAVFWFMGVINWFIKCSILTALMPISIILFLFNGKRQQFFSNVYLMFGQALVPIVLVTLFFVVANSSLIIDLVAQEMIPIFNTKLMVKVGMEMFGLSDDFQKAVAAIGDLELSTQEMATSAMKQNMFDGMIGGATAGFAGAALLAALGVASGGIIPLLALGIGATMFGSALGGLMNISAEEYTWQVILLISYVVEGFYFLFCIFMNIFLFKFFWQADNFVNEIIGSNVRNDMMNPDKALQNFGMGRFGAN